MKYIYILTFILTSSSAHSEYEWQLLEDNIWGANDTKMVYDSIGNLYYWANANVMYSTDDGIHWEYFSQKIIRDIVCGYDFVIFSSDSLFITFNNNTTRTSHYNLNYPNMVPIINLIHNRDTIIFSTTFFPIMDTVEIALHYSTNIDGPYQKSITTIDSTDRLFITGRKGIDKLIVDRNNNYFSYTPYQGVFLMPSLHDTVRKLIYQYTKWDYWNDINIYQDTTLIILHDNKLKYTNNLGETWDSLGSELGRIRSFTTYKNQILLTTYDSLYLTTDFGKSWDVIKSGIYEEFPSQPYVSGKGTYFLVSFGWGVYRAIMPTDVEGDYPVLDDDILISPNPATDYINISGDIAGEVKIYDLLGVCVLSQGDSRFRGNDRQVSEGNVRIDVSELSSGIYFVRVGGKVLKFVKL